MCVADGLSPPDKTSGGSRWGKGAKNAIKMVGIDGDNWGAGAYLFSLHSPPAPCDQKKTSPAALHVRNAEKGEHQIYSKYHS